MGNPGRSIFCQLWEARLSVNIRNVNNVEHMESVNTTAEGASLRFKAITCRADSLV